MGGYNPENMVGEMIYKIWIKEQWWSESDDIVCP